jgi:hypothetical protein
MSKPDTEQTKRCRIAGEWAFRNPEIWPKAKKFATMETIRSGEYTTIGVMKRRKFRKKVAQEDNGKTVQDRLG